MGLRWSNIVIDCSDAQRVGEFWAAVFDLELHGETSDGGGTDELWIEPGGDFPDILFLEVGEAKTVKNRLHLDLRPDDQEAEVARLEALGARRIDIGQGDVTWW